jgi:acyl carrier protein
MGAHPDIRTFIADQLGMAVECITDEVHLADDLKLDRFARLELAIEIEEKFGVEFTQEALDYMEVVGDIIRYVESDLNKPVIVSSNITLSGRHS